MHREKKTILREYYVLDKNSRIYPIDQELISKCTEIVIEDGFSSLRGADLIFACIAYLEDAYLVTKDKGFSAVCSHISVIDLNMSMHSANYHDQITDHTTVP